MDTATGTPYCGNCNYDLTGLTDSPRCPECGKPLVDVMQRRGYGVGGARVGRRYRSKATLFGLPVIDIALGPSADQRVGRAKGIIAIGDISVGFLSIGGFAFGMVCFGGISVGLLTLGGTSISLLAGIGGLSVSGGLAVGGAAFGSIASGGGAFGYIAQGGGAQGHWVRDGATFGRPPHIFRTLHWLLGGGVATMLLFPAFWIMSTILLAGGVIAVIAKLRLLSYARQSPSPGKA